MIEKRIPFVSIATAGMMVVLSLLFAIAGPGALFGLWMYWGVCLVFLFLFECLFGLSKKRFAPNIGVAIPTAGLLALLIKTICAIPDATGMDGLGILLYLIAFGPMSITAIITNIVCVVGKIQHGKANKHN